MTSPDWFHLFLDVPRPRWQEAVRFWCAATAWQPSALRGENNQFVTLSPPEGDAWLKMQTVDEVEPRIHIDLDSRDRAAAVARASTLGARPAWTYENVVVMRSPGGLLFCHTLTDVDSPRFARSDHERVLDQVCIDIPPSLWDQEIRFWAAITGRAVEQSTTPEFMRLNHPDPTRGPRILLQRLADERSEVGAHPDFAVANRAAETGRHEALGAETVGVFDWWTVMRAPDGQVYCLTDRDPLTGRVTASSGEPV